MNTSTTTTHDPLATMRRLTMVIYVLYAASVLAGVSAIAAVVINYVMRDDARGTVYESHFTWQIRTFWWGLLWAVIGGLTMFLIVGFAILAANGLWLVYRSVKGLLYWQDGRPMPT